MPYFPTDEPWTQVLLPPRPGGPIRHANPPLPAQTTRENTQRTLGVTQSGQLGLNSENRPIQPPRPTAPPHNNDRNANNARPHTNSPRPHSRSSPTPTPTDAEEHPAPAPAQTSTLENATPAGTPTHATPESHSPQPFPAPSPLHKTPQPKLKAPKLVLKSLRPPNSPSYEAQESLLSPTPSLPGGLPEQSNTNHNFAY